MKTRMKKMRAVNYCSIKVLLGNNEGTCGVGILLAEGSLM